MVTESGGGREDPGTSDEAWLALCAGRLMSRAAGPPAKVYLPSRIRFGHGSRLALAPTGRFVLGEAADHVAAVDRVAAQRRADLGDDGPVAAGDDLVLLTRGRDAHRCGL